jgi:hypothetical protein
MIPEISERFPTRPINLVCPLCKAKVWQICKVLPGRLDIIHVERTELAAEVDALRRD